MRAPAAVPPAGKWNIDLEQAHRCIGAPVFIRGSRSLCEWHI
jgi:hypothetical protein